MYNTQLLIKTSQAMIMLSPAAITTFLKTIYISIFDHVVCKGLINFAKTSFISRCFAFKVAFQVQSLYNIKRQNRLHDSHTDNDTTTKIYICIYICIIVLYIVGIYTPTLNTCNIKCISIFYHKDLIK